jgi:hypothetical protein
MTYTSSSAEGEAMGWAIVGLLLAAPIVAVVGCAYRAVRARSVARRLSWAVATMLVSGLSAAVLLALSVLLALGHAFFIELPNVDLPASQQKHDPTPRHVADPFAAGFWLFALVALLAALAVVACLGAALWQKARPRPRGRA